MSDELNSLINIIIENNFEEFCEIIIRYNVDEIQKLNQLIKANLCYLYYSYYEKMMSFNLKIIMYILRNDTELYFHIILTNIFLHFIFFFVEKDSDVEPFYNKIYQEMDSYSFDIRKLVNFYIHLEDMTKKNKIFTGKEQFITFLDKTINHINNIISMDDTGTILKIFSVVLELLKRYLEKSENAISIYLNILNNQDFFKHHSTLDKIFSNIRVDMREINCSNKFKQIYCGYFHENIVPPYSLHHINLLRYYGNTIDESKLEVIFSITKNILENLSYEEYSDTFDVLFDFWNSSTRRSYIEMSLYQKLHELKKNKSNVRNTSRPNEKELEKHFISKQIPDDEKIRVFFNLIDEHRNSNNLPVELFSIFLNIFKNDLYIESLLVYNTNKFEEIIGKFFDLLEDIINNYPVSITYYLTNIFGILKLIIKPCLSNFLDGRIDIIRKVLDILEYPSIQSDITVYNQIIVNICLYYIESENLDERALKNINDFMTIVIPHIFFLIKNNKKPDNFNNAVRAIECLKDKLNLNIDLTKLKDKIA